MNILVCVKQVPGNSNVTVDPQTGVLCRDGVASKLNPYDLYALEMAMCLRGAKGKVTTLSMGPRQAKAALLETIYMGADEGVLLCDRRFAGADVLATSRTLAAGIKAIDEYDLILCGKQTTDGDTAQVGSEVAEFLGIGCACNVSEIVEADSESIQVKLNMDNLIQIQRLSMPCLLSVDHEINTPRLPSLKRKWKIDEENINVLTLDDLPGIDENNCGLKGSPTQVKKIFPPEKKVAHEIYQGKEAATALFELLKSNKVL